MSDTPPVQTEDIVTALLEITSGDEALALPLFLEHGDGTQPEAAPMMEISGQEENTLQPDGLAAYLLAHEGQLLALATELSLDIEDGTPFEAILSALQAPEPNPELVEAMSQIAQGWQEPHPVADREAGSDTPALTDDDDMAALNTSVFAQLNCMLAGDQDPDNKPEAPVLKHVDSTNDLEEDINQRLAVQAREREEKKHYLGNQDDRSFDIS